MKQGFSFHEIFVDPTEARPPRKSEGEVPSAVARFRDRAEPHLEWTRRLLADLPAVVFLVDGDGRVLWSTAPSPGALRDAGAEPACDWSKASMGTNPVERALVSREPVVSVGRPGAEPAWRRFTTLAAPVGGSWVRPQGVVAASVEGDAVAPERLAAAAYAAYAIGRDEGALQSATDEDGRIRRLLDAAPDAMVVAEPDGRIVFANAAVEALLGYRIDELVGRPVEVLVPEGLRERHVRHREGYVKEPRTRLIDESRDLRARRKDGREIPVEISLGPVRTREGLLVCAAIRDVSVRREARRRLEIQDAVSRSLAESSTLDEAAPRILEAVARSVGWDAAAVWRLDAAESRMRSVSTWGAPFLDGSEYLRLTRALTFERGADLPGLVWAAGLPVLVPDVTAEPRYLRAAAAREGGLRSVFGFPIVLQGQILGAFEFASRQRIETDEATLTMLATLGSQVGHFMERRRAEEEVRNREAKLRHVLQEMPLALWTTDLEMRFNYGAGRLFGKPPVRPVEALLGRIMPEALGPDHPTVQAHREALQGAPGRFTVEKEGSTYKGVVEPLRDAEGRIVGAVGVASDVTALRQVEEDLRRIQRRLEDAERIAGAGSWEWDVAADTVAWSPNLYRLFGVEPSRFPGTFTGFLDIVHPDDRDRVRRTVEMGLENRKPFSYEGRIVRPDGREILILARGEVHCDASGAPVRMLGTAQDVTERRRAEEEIRRLNAGLEERVRRRTAELEDAFEELAAFTYTVAHDLRAPLRALHGLSDLLLMDYADRPIDAEGSDYLHRIRAASRRMDDLIQGLLAYSRLGRGEVPVEPVDLELLVRDVVERMAIEIRERDAELRTACEPAVVRANPVLLGQSLANLISNAMTFVAPGVRPRVLVRVERREGGARVSVTDNGIGIEPEHLEKLFGVFQQLHGREDYPGTGIGLALVQRSMRRMGGRVGVESRPGDGSTFWLELPLA